MPPDFTRRSEQIEIMDDLSSSGPLVERTLGELDIINYWLGGNAITMSAIKRLVHKRQRKLRIADLGCGSGDTLRQVATWARKNDIELELEGYDANPFITDYAETHSQDYPEISVFSEDILSKDFASRRFDLVLCTLFLHHFPSDVLAKILFQLKRQTTQWIIINDLHRHWFAYHSIRLLTKAFSRSEMVVNDGPVSVLRGFSKNEILSIMEQAQIERFQARWRWAFRWQWIINCR